MQFWIEFELSFQDDGFQLSVRAPPEQNPLKAYVMVVYIDMSFFNKTKSCFKMYILGCGPTGACAAAVWCPSGLLACPGPTYDDSNDYLTLCWPAEWPQSPTSIDVRRRGSSRVDVSGWDSERAMDCPKSDLESQNLKFLLFSKSPTDHPIHTATHHSHSLLSISCEGKRLAQSDVATHCALA